MENANMDTGASHTAPRRYSELSRIMKVLLMRWVVTIAGLIILALIIIAIFAPLIAPYEPNDQDLSAFLKLPSKDHLLGTDELGRDVLCRIIFGTRISLLVGIVAVAIAGFLGIGLGLIAGYFGGWIGTIVMRFIDALLAFPPLVLMLSISAVIGGGLLNVLVALGIGMMPAYCRLTYGQILSLKENDFIISAHAVGATNLRIMLRHLLPNAFPSLLILMTINLGSAIMLEASLSFIGVGITPPAPAWGSMVSKGYLYLQTNPLLSFSPGFAILLAVLSFNMIGDGLRDALDPRLRGVL